MNVIADISEELGFNLVGQSWMVFNFIDGSKGEIGGGDGFLADGRELHDGNEKCARGFL